MRQILGCIYTQPSCDTLAHSQPLEAKFSSSTSSTKQKIPLPESEHVLRVSRKAECKHTLTLASGLILGLMASLLLLRAGFPPALAAIAFWMVGGAIGLSLMQFAFLKSTVQESARIIGLNPIRALLTGVVVLEVPVLAASCFHLAGAEALAWLCLFFFFGGFLLVLWPANIAYLVGKKLAPEQSLTRQVVAGSFVATTSLFIPILGWIWLLYLAVLTTGGFCLRGRHV